MGAVYGSGATSYLPYLPVGAQRIWSSFNTQLESPTLNVATVLPSSRAITMLLSAACAAVEDTAAAITRAFRIRIAAVIFSSFAVRSC